MVALADDDRMKTFAHQFRQAAMRDMDERTSRLQHVQSAFANRVHRALRRAVRRDHHRLRRHRRGLLLNGSPWRAVPPARFRCGPGRPEWSAARVAPRGFQRQRDGVPHPKAHAQMFCADDFHINFVSQSKRPAISFKRFYLGLFCRTICSSRLMYSAKAFRPAAVSEQVVSGRLF